MLSIEVEVVLTNTKRLVMKTRYLIKVPQNPCMLRVLLDDSRGHERLVKGDDQALTSNHRKNF